MIKAHAVKEIAVEVANQIGLMNGIAKIIAEKGVSILAVNGSVCGGEAVIRLITDDNLRAVDELRRKKYDVRETAAVGMKVPHKPGMLQKVTQKLAEADIDVDHIYATATLDSTESFVVLACSDNDRAIVILNK